MALENRLGITDSAELARTEEKISKQKALTLFEAGILDTLTPGTSETLCAIHKYLFEDIYDFAGKLRTVNLAKGNFRFAPLIYLEAALADEVGSREVYRNGIDHSYYYEGYTTFRAEDLSKE